MVSVILLQIVTMYIYGESWESCCAKSRVPVQKIMHLWVSCDHTVNLKTDSKTLYYSSLKLKYTPTYCKGQQKLKEISVVLTTATRTATEITQTRHSTKNIFRSINCSFCPTGRMLQTILRLWEFLCIRDAGVMQRKQNHCGICTWRTFTLTDKKCPFKLEL